MPTPSTQQKRSPVVVIMGHIDHGKSTLLSYIRQNTKALNEAGGITQHVSAYEATDSHGNTLTFIDTPGHAAFSGHRNRGASIADIAVLAVSAEDGVKPQTLEALRSIEASKIPYIVALTKIDKPSADVNRAKVSLAENGVYVEGYGGDISVLEVSGVTGAGIPELLETINLTAEIHGLTGDTTALAHGIILESSLDNRKGISAMCIIKDGTMKKGQFAATPGALTPVRMLEDWTGKAIDSAAFSSPVRIIGWDSVPKVGDTFKVFATKDEAEKYAAESGQNANATDAKNGAGASTADSMAFMNKATFRSFPLILKADSGGSLEAVSQEIARLANDKIVPRIVSSGIGTITESDVRQAYAGEKAIVIGFNVKTDAQARSLADRNEVNIQNFDIIYKLSEWLQGVLAENTPTEEVEEIVGVAKVLKVFSRMKDKQVLGCRVETGSIRVDTQVRIIRRESEIGSGRIRELQQQKNKTSEVEEGKECGAMIEAKMEIAPGDKLHIIAVVKR